MKHFVPSKRELPPIGTRKWLDTGFHIQLVEIAAHVDDEHVSVKTDEGSEYKKVHISNVSL